MLLSVRPDSLIGACPPPRACGGDVGGSLIRSIADGLLTLHDLLELPPDVTLAPSPSSCAESKLPRRIGELPAATRVVSTMGSLRLCAVRREASGCWQIIVSIERRREFGAGLCKILLGTTRVEFEGCVALCVCAMALVSMDQIVPNTKRMVRRVVHVHVNANGRRALSPGEVGLIN